MPLKRFLEPRAPSPFRSKPRAGESCELCTEPIADDHAHVVDLESRHLLCVCHACSLLFTPEGAGGRKYRAVPRRHRYAREVVLTDAQWDRLQIPVGIAFFFFNTTLGRTAAFYPSPAGATESLLSLDTWDELVREHPLLADLLPDVEALLVQKRDGGFECFIVPIDTCYVLVGRVRRSWKGFDGGQEAWRDIDAFFADVRARSENLVPATEGGA